MKELIYNLVNNTIEAVEIPERFDFTDEEIRDMAIELYLGKKIDCCYNEVNTIKTTLIAYEGIIMRGDGIRFMTFKALDEECIPVRLHEYIVLAQYKKKHPIKYRMLIKSKNKYEGEELICNM